MEQKIAAVLSNEKATSAARKVLEVLQHRAGSINAITRNDLMTALGFKFPQTAFSERKVRAAIRELVEDFHIPITGSSSGVFGYYIVATEDERQSAVSDLRSRIDSLLVRAGVLETISLGTQGEVAAA